MGWEIHIYIYIINRRWLKIDSCGTPYTILRNSLKDEPTLVVSIILFNNNKTVMISVFSLKIADRFPVSKSLFLLETTGLISNLGRISTIYLLNIFSYSISEVTTISFSIKVILFLVVTLFPKADFTVY